MATAKQTLAVRKDDDFYAWLLDQARTLRHIAGQVPSLDCADIAEELEGMARSDEHALESFLERLLKHLLKWRYESHRQSPSWRVSIQNARSDIRDRLADSPSLQAKLPTLKRERMKNRVVRPVPRWKWRNANGTRNPRRHVPGASLRS